MPCDRFDKTAGNPLKCQLTFLCPIEGGMGGDPEQGAAPSDAARDTLAAAGERRVPTTFSVVVPKFYPHDPPLVYAERCETCLFSQTSSIYTLVLDFRAC